VRPSRNGTRIRLPRGFGRLADRLRHLAGLAVAEADAAFQVTHHHQRREAETLAALDHLGHAVDVHELVFELALAIVAIATAVSVSCVARHA
jgi:hypothetical protein